MSVRNDGCEQLSHQVVFHLLPDPEGRVIPVPTTLSYSVRDPYAVCLTFTTGHRKRVVWTVAWDLLHEGLTRPAGMGDVQVAPSRLDPQWVEVALTDARSGAVRVFRVTRSTLAGFLTATENLNTRPLPDAVWDRWLRRMVAGSGSPT